MTNVSKISINQYDYDLPDERIARFPLEKRDQSKLLVYKDGVIEETVFKNIYHSLPENSLLIFNNTKVIHARLFFQKKTGAKIEIFCLNPVEPIDYQQSFASTNKVVWECLIGNSKKWKEGSLKKEITINNEKVVIEATKIEKKESSFHVEFRWTGNLTFSQVIEHVGTLPIPPYLNRETEASDEINYQTVYAKMEGSVAAPTAGLHFTQAVLKNLKDKNITADEVTLHVGAGTFRPVKTELIADHDMHTEMVVISKQTIERLLENRKIIAVGTTSVRSLESLYWLGIQLADNKNWKKHLTVEQWLPYQNKENLSKKESLANILSYLEEKQLPSIQFTTKIIIVPGYQFKIIEGIITNFHQPKSTLLLLVSAFVGDQWKEIYQHALDNEFRFLSYGDSNLYL